MARVSVTLHQGALDRLLRRPGGPVYDNVVAGPLRRTHALTTARAPVDTGFLRNNTAEEITASAGQLQGKLTYKAHYAIFVFKGTRYMRARPVLQESFVEACPWPVTLH